MKRKIPILILCIFTFLLITATENLYYSTKTNQKDFDKVCEIFSEYEELTKNEWNYFGKMSIIQEKIKPYGFHLMTSYSWEGHYFNTTKMDRFAFAQLYPYINGKDISKINIRGVSVIHREFIERNVEITITAIKITTNDKNILHRNIQRFKKIWEY